MVNISTIWCNKGGFFNRKGFSLTERRDLFYGGCVTIRLAIVLLVYFFMVSDMKKAHIVIPSLIITFSALSVVHALSCLRADDKVSTPGGVYPRRGPPILGVRRSKGAVWWSRKFGLVIAILLICLSGYVLYEIVEHDRGEAAERRSDYALMLSLPIAIHLFLGILLSFTVYPSYFSS